MAITNSSYSTVSLNREAEGSGGFRLIILLLLVVTLLIAGYFFLFPTDTDIELEPPLSHTIDPIIRARIEAAKQAEEEQSRKAIAAAQAEAENRPADSTTEGKAETTTAVEPPSTAQEKIAQVTPTAPSVVAPPAEIPKWIRDQEHARDGEIARTLIQSIRRGEEPLSTDQVHTRASELQSAGRETDAYLLYFYAARQGHGPSAFALGSMNDPSHFITGNELLEKPDSVQAHKWYSIAAAAQVDDARQRLIQLREKTEAAALAGDASAQRLLLNWK